MGDPDGRRTDRIMEPDAVDTDDYSQVMQERRNLITLIVVYVVCVIVVAGVWLA